ncbi:MAG: RDD family protein [Gemmatimonadota bacterium]
MGLGLGWSGLYFTFFIGWWRGLTPGKRLLGIRVVRLDGRPISYWLAFERFGGYAASLFTGLEGFARMIWDRNRQALEDKLAETVVILDTADSRRRVAELHARGTAGGSGARRPLVSRLGLKNDGG